METLDYWTPQDALAFRCTVAQVGTLKPLETSQGVNADGLRTDVALARAYAPRALRALVRVMETESGRAAVEAAREILTRAYGPAQTSLSAPPSIQTSLSGQGAQTGLSGPSAPGWLESGRLAYRDTAPIGARTDDRGEDD